MYNMGLGNPKQIDWLLETVAATCYYNCRKIGDSRIEMFLELINWSFGPFMRISANALFIWTVHTKLKMPVTDKDHTGQKAAPKNIG